jgi:hypothetical protein
VQFARAITDVTATSLRERKNGDTPIGYSEQVDLRRAKCDMTAESRNSGPTNNIHCYATASKHVSMATITRSGINTRVTPGNSPLESLAVKR